MEGSGGLWLWEDRAGVLVSSCWLLHILPPQVCPFKTPSGHHYSLILHRGLPYLISLSPPGIRTKADGTKQALAIWLQSSGVCPLGSAASVWGMWASEGSRDTGLRQSVLKLMGFVLGRTGSAVLLEPVVQEGSNVGCQRAADTEPEITSSCIHPSNLHQALPELWRFHYGFEHKCKSSRITV